MKEVFPSFVYICTLISFPRSKPCVEEEDGLRPPDSRLLPPAPTRIKPRPSQQGNLAAHIVTEFALNVRALCSCNRERERDLTFLSLCLCLSVCLSVSLSLSLSFSLFLSLSLSFVQVLHMSLKRGRFSSSSQEQLQMLDPFVSLLTKTLTSRHTRLLALAVRCLTWLMRFPLPSFHVC